jgi:hypothetical protein
LSVKLELREVGLCPKCSAPIEYLYTLSGPEGEGGVRVYVVSECPVCGFRDSKNLLSTVLGICSSLLLRYSLRRLN